MLTKAANFLVMEHQNATADIEDPYSAIFSDGIFQFVAVAAAVLVLTCGNGFVIHFLWCDEFLLEHKKTLTSQLHHQSFYSLLLANNSTALLCTWRVLFGPLIGQLCSTALFLKVASFKFGLLAIVELLLIKCLYIFIWKSVGMLNDDFIYFFLTICNVTLSIMATLVLLALGSFGSNVSSFLICSGERLNTLKKNGLETPRLRFATFYICDNLICL